MSVSSINEFEARAADATKGPVITNKWAFSCAIYIRQRLIAYNRVYFDIKHGDKDLVSLAKMATTRMQDP